MGGVISSRLEVLFFRRTSNSDLQMLADMAPPMLVQHMKRKVAHFLLLDHFLGSSSTGCAARKQVSARARALSIISSAFGGSDGS